MNFSSRKLTAQDFGILDSFLDSKNTVFKTWIESDKQDHNKSTLLACLKEPTETSVYGSFKDGLLTAIMAATVWKATPYFSFHDLHIPKRFSSFESNYAINSLFEVIFTEMHKQGRFSGYFLTLARPYQKNYFSQFSLQPIEESYPVFKDYVISLECLIPAHTDPEFETYWRLMTMRTHPVDLWVRRATLKNEKILGYLRAKPEFKNFFPEA